MTNLRQNLIFLVILLLPGAVSSNEVLSGSLEADFSSWGKPALQGQISAKNADQDTVLIHLLTSFSGGLKVEIPEGLMCQSISLLFSTA